jgi:capsular exopolysaccharide synthesis family protein
LPLLTLEDVRTILVTSTHEKEGKTTLLTHLGILMAQYGHSVLLLDGSAESPSLHILAPGVSESGLCDILLGGATPEEAIRPSVIANLDVLPLGSLKLPAVRAVGDGRFDLLLQELRERYDVVLIDSGAIGSSLLPNALARSADGVLFVIRSGKVERERAAVAVAALRQAKANVLGAVLNKHEGKATRPSFFLERVLQKDMEQNLG